MRAVVGNALSITKMRSAVSAAANAIENLENLPGGSKSSLTETRCSLCRLPIANNCDALCGFAKRKCLVAHSQPLLTVSDFSDKRSKLFEKQPPSDTVEEIPSNGRSTKADWSKRSTADQKVTPSSRPPPAIWAGKSFLFIWPTLPFEPTADLILWFGTCSVL
jgi:hypothetical protein